MDGNVVTALTRLTDLRVPAQIQLLFALWWAKRPENKAHLLPPPEVTFSLVSLILSLLTV